MRGFSFPWGDEEKKQRLLIHKTQHRAERRSPEESVRFPHEPHPEVLQLLRAGTEVERGARQWQVSRRRQAHVCGYYGVAGIGRTQVCVSKGAGGEGKGLSTAVPDVLSRHQGGGDVEGVFGQQEEVAVLDGAVQVLSRVRPTVEPDEEEQDRSQLHRLHIKQIACDDEKRRSKCLDCSYALLSNKAMKAIWS